MGSKKLYRLAVRGTIEALVSILHDFAVVDGNEFAEVYIKDESMVILSEKDYSGKNKEDLGERDTYNYIRAAQVHDIEAANILDGMRAALRLILTMGKYPAGWVFRTVEELPMLDTHTVIKSNSTVDYIMGYEVHYDDELPENTILLIAGEYKGPALEDTTDVVKIIIRID